MYIPVTLETIIASAELDLHGYSRDDANTMVDGILGHWIERGHREGIIIHGNGTGTLRNDVDKLLRAHRYAKSYSLVAGNEGRTRVVLRELETAQEEAAQSDGD